MEGVDQSVEARSQDLKAQAEGGSNPRGGGLQEDNERRARAADGGSLDKQRREGGTEQHSQ